MAVTVDTAIVFVSSKTEYGQQSVFPPTQPTMGAQSAVGPSRSTYSGVTQYCCRRFPEPVYGGTVVCGVGAGGGPVDILSRTRLGTEASGKSVAHGNWL